MAEAGTGRLRRLAEELQESGLGLDRSDAVGQMLLEEIDQALRPTVHERRIASGGTIIEPGGRPGHSSSSHSANLVTSLSLRHGALPTGSQAGSSVEPTAASNGSCSTGQRDQSGTSW